MAELRFSQGFVEDMRRIESAGLRERVYRALAPLETLPRYGSTDIPRFATSRFGSGLYKLVVAPYDIYYHYDQRLDVVEVDGMIPMRMQR